MSRKPLSKKLRFEIFKRDAFTCQYCGRKAPDVILQCDHVHPVAENGDNDILNLITACWECNSGKGARVLSEQAALNKQRDQLEELQERRDQIDMMLEWRRELQNIDDDTVEKIAGMLASRWHFVLNELGKQDIRKWIRKYPLDVLTEAIEASFVSYIKLDKDGRASLESAGKAFAKVPAFASIQQQKADKPYIGRLLYIQGIIRKRARMPRYDCVGYLEHLHLCGKSLDELERAAKRINSIHDFDVPMDDWLAEIGNPY